MVEPDGSRRRAEQTVARRKTIWHTQEPRCLASPCMSELLANWQAWAFGVCRRARSIRNDAQEAFKKTSPRGRSSLEPAASPWRYGFRIASRARSPVSGRAWNNTRYIWSYIFGAVCPERAEAAALHATQERASRRSLKPCIGRTCPSHSGWLARFGRAGGTRPYSPELNPMENVFCVPTSSPYPPIMSRSSTGLRRLTVQAIAMRRCWRPWPKLALCGA